MKIIQSNKEDAEKKAVKQFKKEVNNLLKKQDQVIVGLCGGRSIQGILKLLGKQELPWKQIHFFMVDERQVPIRHEDSNFKQAYDLLFANLLEENVLDKTNLHPYDYEKPISEYTKLLQKSEGFDICFFGVGEDGHIAGLYPNHHSVKNEAKGFITMADSPKPPKDRMTMSKYLVNQSKVNFVLFFGDAKKNAYEMFLDKSTSITKIPAKLTLNNKTIVVTNYEKQ